MKSAFSANQASVPEERRHVRSGALVCYGRVSGPSRIRVDPVIGELRVAEVERKAIAVSKNGISASRGFGHGPVEGSLYGFGSVFEVWHAVHV